MTHEIKHLFETLAAWQQSGKKAVFVSVVALNGSSYRRPGVRMLIREDGEYAGAVSGGCVESEIERQAQSVFINNKAKIISYDGRLRIGCEGIITILIEPVFLSSELLLDFEKQLENRRPFKLESTFRNEVGEYSDVGSVLILDGKQHVLNPSFSIDSINNQPCFEQEFGPLFQLYIFGAEHDAVQLCQAAKLLGWEVIVVASPDQEKSCDYFPGARALITPAIDNIDTSGFDEQTAVVLITHSFNKDVQYLMALKDTKLAYLGLLGSVSRRERVISMLLDYNPDIPLDFLDQIHGPTGINIGAESASEIAISILAEILSVVRSQRPVALREKEGAIHG
ncbi:XdhC family protein [Prolixibacteraceae bacterium Z1-6]|uniref:XdhC family protein n=1 Tax=Draconibacterium aestuarii TaxID=2998507 RepID=A0A9X3FE02_9BACT|nr:XdhC family protein [Prolixibacteraceae bacterium Z1-6]